MFIYKITNTINKKIYVGQTTSTIKHRFSQHCCPSHNGSYLGRAIAKYGKENFVIEVLEECSSIEELNSKEEEYIASFNSLTPNGYNVLHGGLNFKRTHYPMQGRTHSDVTKKKMSDAAVSKVRSEEHKANILLANNKRLGKKASDATRRNMSLARTGLRKKGRVVENIITGEIFKSISIACDVLGLPRRSVNRILKTNNTYNGLLRLVEEK